MTNEKIILVEFLQENLAGKLDSSTNLNVSFLADAILEKLELNRTTEERNVRKVEEAIKSFNKMINDIDVDMDTELAQLGKEEILVKNFAMGQKTACDKLRESLTKI